jgi:DNA-binding NtrC family response regulator
MAHEQKKPVVMAVDDDPLVLRTLNRVLEAEGFDAKLCSSGRSAVEGFDKSIYTILLDITMPDMSGLDVFEKLKQKNPLIPIIFYTGLADRDKRRGIRNRCRPHAYVVKGGDREELVDTVIGAVESYTQTLRALSLQADLELKEKQNLELRKDAAKRASFESLCSNNPTMKEIGARAKKASEVPYPVLISGETGTGKELLAVMIHYNSARAFEAFVIVNCAAIPYELVESELFGHERGAFTGADQKKAGLFEIANNGTIFLDEIGDLSGSAQAKILRVVQEKQFQRVGGTEPIRVDVRILAATNKNLAEEIKHKHFREDLFYRLNAISIYLPPLRERKCCIHVLANQFLEESCKELKKHIPGISQTCMSLLERYYWPGNVRELKNVIERLVTWAEKDSVITEEHLPLELLSHTVGASENNGATGKLYQLIHAVEKDAIANALKEAGGNKSKAAEILGVSRSLLYKKIELYGLLAEN